MASGSEYCYPCYLGGQPIQAAFSKLIAKLDKATGLDFYATHTAGGCFAIVAHPSPDIIIYVTAAPDVFAIDDTPAKVRKQKCGYLVGFYNHDDGDTLAMSDTDAKGYTNLRTYDAVVAEVLRLGAGIM